MTPFIGLLAKLQPEKWSVRFVFSIFRAKRKAAKSGMN